MQNDPSRSEEREAAQASDVEQAHHRAGNPRDTREADPQDSTPAADVTGSSGHVPRAETVHGNMQHGETGSPGAEADRAAAQRNG